MFCSKAQCFSSLEVLFIAQVHVTAASRGWVIDWDWLSVIFVQLIHFWITKCIFITTITPRWPRRCGGGGRDCRASSIADFDSGSAWHNLHGTCHKLYFCRAGAKYFDIFCKNFIELLNLATSSSCDARLSAGCVILRWSRKKYLTELLFVYSFIHEFSSWKRNRRKNCKLCLKYWTLIVKASGEKCDLILSSSIKSGASVMTSTFHIKQNF